MEMQVLIKVHRALSRTMTLRQGWQVLEKVTRRSVSPRVLYHLVRADCVTCSTAHLSSAGPHLASGWAYGSWLGISSLAESYRLTTGGLLRCLSGFGALGSWAGGGAISGEVSRAGEQDALHVGLSSETLPAAVPVLWTGSWAAWLALGAGEHDALHMILSLTGYWAA